MQVDKTGRIINFPQYAVYGKDERRRLKKKLASLRKEVAYIELLLKERYYK